MSEKEIGAILFMYYINNYCEDMFSFDNGETLNKVKAYYKKLKEKYIEDNIKAIENNIKIREPEGTDYDSMEFYYEEMPYIFVQATAMFDYDGKPVDGYTGDSEWADTALFFVDDVACEFDDLDE
jgi:hypothetical protein